MQSDAEWQAWGKRDPLFGVASWPGRERGGSDPWTDEEFYALGRDWLDFERAWYNAAAARPNGTVLEIGCGAGRMTRMLAQSFDAVIAVDVSADVIAYARARVLDERISWQVSRGDVLPATPARVDAVFSCHVFQHFPDNRAQLAMFREIARVLKPGGSFFIHLPLHVFPGGRFAPSARALYAVYQQLNRAQTFLRLRLMAFGLKPPMRGVSYEMDRLLADLHEIGFVELQIVMTPVGSAGTPNPCVYGRKR